MPDPERLSMPLGEALYSLRAIRRVREDPIPNEDLREILEAAIRAPSGGNRQPWHFLLITGAEERAALGELYHEAWWAKRSDAGIHGPEDIPEGDSVSRSAMRLADEIGRAPAIVLVCATARGRAAAESVIPATQNLLLAARALGVGGTITTLHPVVDERLHERFGIPAEVEVVYCVPLGYPRGNFGPTSRMPLDQVLSVDRWGAAAEWA